jgi:hypothetical protein
MRRTALAIALAASFAILVGGYFLIVSPAEGTINDTIAQSETLQQRIASDEAFIRDFPKEQAARKKQLSALKPINLHANASQMVANFVSDLDKSVRVNGIGFMSAQVNPAQPPPAPVGSPNPNATPVATLVPTAVHMTIEGTYGQILTAIAAASRASTLANIDQVSFRRHVVKDPSANPTLDAEVNVTLYSVLFPPPRLNVMPAAGAPFNPQTIPAVDPQTLPAARSAASPPSASVPPSGASNAMPAAAPSPLPSGASR